MLRGLGRWAVVVWLLCLVGGAWAQEAKPAALDYTRRNTWTLFVEGSPNSSHILMGVTPNRILLDAGGSYARRLARTRTTAFSYVGEIRPAVFESDPVNLTRYITTVILGPKAGQTFVSDLAGVAFKCFRSDTQELYGYPAFGDQPAGEEVQRVINRCGRRWTFGQSYLPVGMKYSLRTQEPLQPFVDAFLGYMYTSRAVPFESASPFNYVFGAGAGVEVYRTRSRSLALEARWQHFSNKDTAVLNPGVDNIVYRMSYSFGR